MAGLLYGSGLRLIECAQVRVKDFDFGAGHLIVRQRKGKKDRLTLLPNQLRQPLREHLSEVERQHKRDLADGARHVELPGALAIKYPNASREWPWQWAFPATRQYRHPSSGLLYRHHLHETVLEARDVVAARMAFESMGVSFERALGLPSHATAPHRTFWEQTRQFQEDLLRRALEKTDWNVSLTAKHLVLSRREPDDIA